MPHEVVKFAELHINKSQCRSRDVIDWFSVDQLNACDDNNDNYTRSIICSETSQTKALVNLKTSCRMCGSVQMAQSRWATRTDDGQIILTIG
jgi:hypothetical protein